LLRSQEFKELEAIRNILTHRLCGERDVSLISLGGSSRRLDVWVVNGLKDDTPGDLELNHQLLGRRLDSLTNLLRDMITAALEFVQEYKPDRHSYDSAAQSWFSEMLRNPAGFSKR
jgi:hypothetical protein